MDPLSKLAEEHGLVIDRKHSYLFSKSRYQNHFRDVDEDEQSEELSRIFDTLAFTIVDKDKLINRLYLNKEAENKGLHFLNTMKIVPCDARKMLFMEMYVDVDNAKKMTTNYN